MASSADKFKRRLASGELLFRQGDEGHEAYLIESGAIEIYLETQGLRKALARLGPDDIFGEMGVLGMDQTRTASAAALEPTVISVITRERLQEKLADADPLLRYLLDVTLTRAIAAMRRERGDAPLQARAVVAGKEQSAAVQRLRLEREIEQAMASGEFQLHYQPILRLADGRVAGFESLIRWVRPDGSRVPPDQFIGVAEESGLIVPLGHWIIRSACAGLAALDRTGTPPVFVNINLSSRQFDDPALFNVIEQALHQHRLPPQRIKLEITESLVMGNMESALKLMHNCRALGCKLAVDDFGTGYSSLSYLHKLPVDVLKLDRSFIRELATSPAALKIVRAVAGMAQELGIETVVEGVETAEQVEACRQAGINLAQGWAYSPALPLDKAAEYLQKNASTS